MAIGCTGQPLDRFDPSRCRLVLGLPLCQCDYILIVLRAKTKVIIQGYLLGWTDEVLLVMEPDRETLTGIRIRDIKAIHFDQKMYPVILKRMMIGGSSGSEK